MPEQPTRVITGATDDGRHHLRQLLAGLLGWLLWAVLILWFASEASADALDVAIFLVTAVVLAAFILVLTGVGLLRPALMRERKRVPPSLARELERPSPVSGAPSALTGEVAVEVHDGERRYVSLTRTSA